MATIIDYLMKNGQRSFADFPLNELDLVCLNEIGYITYGEVLGDAFDVSQEIRLRDVLEAYQGEEDQLHYNFLVTKNRVALFEVLVASERFADLRLSHYVNEVSAEYEKQFAAMVFRLPAIGHTQIVFRGTDDTMIGWKEDFKLTYAREISAHRSAISYLKNYLIQNPEQVVVSGHSKGGNLALYAASHLPANLQGRLASILMLDAPGLQEVLLQSQSYQAIRQRLHVIRPEDSIVGVMLYNDVPPEIVKGQSFGILQHNVVNWLVDVDAGCFLPADKPTELSQNLEQTFKEWTRELSPQDLKLVVDTVFDTLLTNGITSLNDITFDRESGAKLASVVASLRSIGPEKKMILSKSAKLLLLAFAGNTKLGKLEKPDFTLPKLSDIRQRFDK